MAFEICRPSHSLLEDRDGFQPKEVQMPKEELPVPSFFDPSGLDKAWRVDYSARAAEAGNWVFEHQLRPASLDRTTTCLLLVDVQNTFCLPDYELFVAGRSGKGAVEDNIRLCCFIYRNLHRITKIFVSMDTHKAFQIFHPVFLVDEYGNHPEPFTEVTVADVASGRWRVNPAVMDGQDMAPGHDLKKFLGHYVRSLREQGKYGLMIWPYHAMLGGIGHALVSGVEEAVFFHSVARGSQTRFLIKGDNPLTENYSVFSPEIDVDEGGAPITGQDEGFLEELLACDRVFVTGQAKSHCVAWTVWDLLERICKRDASLAKKIYLLEDCMSPVVIPGQVDFTDAADKTFALFAEAGMNRVSSVDSMRSLAGVEFD
jgi:nicotinamidase-related amidase